MAKGSDNCTQDCPFSVESPALRPVPASSVHPGHVRAEVLHQTQSTPLLASWFLHPSQPLGCSTLPHGGRPQPGGRPWSHQPQSPARWHRRTESFHRASLDAARGPRRSRPPAAAARCLLLSCPMQQSRGLGYRTVSNFVPVPRHQGRGT